MEKEKEIQAFVENFSLIKACVGWSAEEFAKHVGTTRQTINNVENKKYKMSVILYNAMRYALDDEIRTHPEDTKMLQIFLDAFVDNPNDFEKYSKEQRDEIMQKTRLLSPAIQSKTISRKEVSTAWVGLVGAAVVAGAIATITLGAWKNRK